MRFSQEEMFTEEKNTIIIGENIKLKIPDWDKINRFNEISSWKIG